MGAGRFLRWLTPALLLAPGSCGRQETMGPPTIYYGQDVCDACAMIVSDERFAAALVELRDGDVATRLFDDVGELLGAEPGPAEGRVAWYVHDMQSLAWLGAQDAFYLRSEALHTPMAFHVAAFATREAAENARGEYGGDVLTFAEIRSSLDGTP